MSEALQKANLPMSAEDFIIGPGSNAMSKPAAPILRAVEKPTEEMMKHAATVDEQSAETKNEDETSRPAKSSKRTRNELKDMDVPPPDVLMSLSVRIPGKIHTALLKAAFDRKWKRMPVGTQQEIVSVALAEWLKREGHLE